MVNSLSGTDYTLEEAVSKGLIEYIPFPEALKGKYQAYTQSDLTKLRAAGCDVRFRSVEEGTADYVADLLNETKASGHKIIAVGTTSTRTLETIYSLYGTFKGCSGWTDIFIYPGYQFKAIDYLITNFHLPKSTLVMLVSALAGKDNIMKAYNEAIKNRYRFFSFGDSMLIK